MSEKEERIRRIIPNDKNLSLKDYFASLPKAERRPVIISAPKEELVEAIARLSGKTKMTARRWVYGYVEPCLAEKEKIAELLGCPVEVLFPSSRP